VVDVPSGLSLTPPKELKKTTARMLSSGFLLCLKFMPFVRMKQIFLLFGVACHCANNGWDRRRVLNKCDGVSIPGTGHSSLCERSVGGGSRFFFLQRNVNFHRMWITRDLTATSLKCKTELYAPRGIQFFMRIGAVEVKRHVLHISVLDTAERLSRQPLY
jgi:hypothetical protein